MNCVRDNCSKEAIGFDIDIPPIYHPLCREHYKEEVEEEVQLSE